MTEKERRKQAQSNKGNVVAGSGTRGKPKKMTTMVSVRLDSELLQQLSSLAKWRSVTLSDILREGAEAIRDKAMQKSWFTGSQLPRKSELEDL